MFIIFKHRLIRISAAAIAILSLPKVANSQNREIELILTPRLCVLEESERECNGAITLHWQAPTALSACLYQEGQTQPLHCWQQITSGEYILHPNASRSLHFLLTSPDGGVLADSWFQVLQQQNAHRKRRNPWSFY